MKRKCIMLLMSVVMMFQLSGCGTRIEPTRRTVGQNSETTEASSQKDNAKNGTESNTESNKKNNAEKETKQSETEILTLEEKVGQLFIVRPDSLDLGVSAEDANDQDEDGVTSVSAEMSENVKKYSVGGVCLFGKNVADPTQLKKFTSDLQKASDIPMFITVDEEGGIVARLANNSNFNLPKYKSAAAVASSGDPKDAEKMGKTIGKYLKEYGFNMNFAPDADVNTNPNNPVIGTRAFSSDAKVAASMVKAAAEGFRDSGILPTLKHFPGHGDTNEDSHSALAITHKTLKELQECEFLPFKADDGMHCIMVGHIAAPNITGTKTPATLSKELIDMIPSKDTTLIITDSLSMQAITDTYNSGEAAVKAFNAGCDMLLMPVDFTAAYNAVLSAVKSGEISETRLNESVEKILDYKHSFIDFEIED